jgi:predicted ATPase
MAETAIEYYRTAAAVARKQFADTDAAAQIRRALRLCSEFPESPKRDQTEMDLLVTLGRSVVATHGYSASEAGETFERGLLLSRRSGDRKHNFSLLSGAWGFHIVRGELEESRRLGAECADDGRLHDSPAQDMAGRFILGCSLFHLGRFGESLRLISEATLPDGGNREFNSALALFVGPDIGVFRRAYLAQLYWHLQVEDESAANRDASISLARELGHPFSLAIALDYAALLSVFQQEAGLALSLAEESAYLCRKYGFAYYLAWAEMVSGWAMAARGSPASGLERFRAGLEAFKATGAELRIAFYYALLAEVYAHAGRAGDARASISTGFAFQSKNGELWSVAELHRVHGDLLWADGNFSEARASYGRAVESAREVGSMSFEARAASRLTALHGEGKARGAPRA